MLSCGGLVALGTASCKVTECTESTPDGGSVKKENCVQLQTTIEYREMNERAGGQAWTSGSPISITNKNGSLTVALANPGDERVAFAGTAFTRETDDAEGAERAKANLRGLGDPAFSGDFVSLLAPGGGVNGYHLKVWIPADFDSTLTIRTENGTTTLHGANRSVSTVVDSHAIFAYDLRGTVNLRSRVGDIEARGIPSGMGNVIRAENGDIATYLGAANLAITAKSESGMVSFPAAWMPNLAADKMSGSATLGDGSGTLNVSTGLGDIVLDVLP
jgi:hypothetical protein